MIQLFLAYTERKKAYFLQSNLKKKDMKISYLLYPQEISITHIMIPPRRSGRKIVIVNLNLIFWYHEYHGLPLRSGKRQRVSSACSWRRCLDPRLTSGSSEAVLRSGLRRRQGEAFVEWIHLSFHSILFTFYVIYLYYLLLIIIIIFIFTFYFDSSVF